MKMRFLQVGIGMLVGVMLTNVQWFYRYRDKVVEFRTELEASKLASQELVKWPIEGRQWTTLLHPDHRPERFNGVTVELSLRTPSGDEQLLTIGPNDLLFVGHEPTINKE